MNKLWLLLILSLFAFNFSNAQLLTEDFSYTAGDTIAAHGWTPISAAGTNPISVTSPGLSYAGYAGSGVGNAVTLTTSGEDCSKLLSTPVTTGTVYASAMVSCSNTHTSGDYFLSLGTSTGTYTGRLFIKGSGTGFAFGVAKNSSATSVVSYGATSYTLNTTYLVVLKYTYVTGTSNDSVALFVNPVPGGTEPAAPVIATADGLTGTDASTITAIFLRQGTSSSAPNVMVDGIRVGTTWAQVTPVPPPVTTYYLQSAASDPTLVANWGTNYPDGSGTPPTDFNSGVFNIRNNSSVTLPSAAWSPNLVVVGDSSTVCNFTIPAAYAVTTNGLTVANNSTVNVLNAVNPAFLNNGPTSIIYLNNPGTASLAGTTYGSIISTNTSTITLAAGASIAGNFTIAGPVTCSGSLTFNGTANQTISGTGPCTLGALVINNTGSFTPPNTTGFASWSTPDFGTYNNIVDFQVPFSTGTAANTLTFTNGVLKVSSASTLTQSSFTAATPISTGLWLNNAGASVTASAASWNANGLLRVTAGTLNVGSTSSHTLIPTISSTNNWYIFDGGTANVAGPLRMGSSSLIGNFIMTSGSVTCAIAGNTGSAVPSFGSTASGYYFQSGGDIYLVTPNSNGTVANRRDWSLSSAVTCNIKGGVAHFGTDATPAGPRRFFAQGFCIGAVVEYSAANGADTLAASATVSYYGTVTVKAGSVFDLNNVTNYIYGTPATASAVINHGIITSSAASNYGILRFSGDVNSTQSTYTAFDAATCGTLAAPCSLYVDNYGGLLITNSSTTTNAIVANRVGLYKGIVTLNNAADLMIGAGSTASLYLGNVNYETPGGFSQTPTFNVTTAGLIIGYSNTNQNVAVGSLNELPADRTLIKYLSVNNQLGVSLSSYCGDLSIATLTLSRGSINLGNYNLTLTGSIPAATDSSYVAVSGTGKLTLNVPVSTAVTAPVGAQPIAIANCTIAAGSTTVTMSNTSTITAGMKVNGGGVPANTYVVSVVPNTSVVLSNATTLSGTIYLYFCDYMPISFTNTLAAQNYKFGITSVTAPTGGMNKQWFVQESTPSSTNFSSLTLNWNEIDRGNLPASGTCDIVYNITGSSSAYSELKSHAIMFGSNPYADSTSSFDNQPGDISSGAYLTVVQDNSALPVELSAFTSQAIGRDVQLSWNTKTEKNSSKFEVERSLLSSNAWITAGVINGSGNSNAPKQYTFTERNLQAGKYQYRLKMIDNNGAFEFSKVIETEVALPKNFELSQNYPNPFNPTTKINYSLPNDSKVTLDIYNISGEKVGQLVNNDQAAGYYSVDFGNSTIHKNLSSGVYLYRINAVDKTNGKSFTSIKKMLLLK